MKSSNEKKINDEYINILKQASMLHDIGKVGISDSILNKNSKLSEEEFNIIKLHTVIGSTTIKSVYNEFPDNTFLRMAEEIARYHHEKWNGQGYPEGLKELQIPLSARIVSLADTYDALRTERPYKKSMSHKETINIIKRGRGESFDPLLVDLFIDAKGEIEQLYCDNNKIDEAI
jgi:putative two-component system response regulator